MDVPKTATEIDERIAEQTQRNIAYFAHKGREPISRRLRELDEEWQIDRVVETQAASLIVAGLVLGVVFSRRWFFFSAAVAGFLLQHAVRGWYPMTPVLRRFGVRTAREIEDERNALIMRLHS